MRQELSEKAKKWMRPRRTNLKMPLLMNCTASRTPEVQLFRSMQWAPRHDGHVRCSEDHVQLDRAAMMLMSLLFRNAIVACASHVRSNLALRTVDAGAFDRIQRRCRESR